MNILNLNKRQKIIITAVILTIGLLSTQLVDFNLRFRFIGGLAVLAYLKNAIIYENNLENYQKLYKFIVPNLINGVLQN